MDAVDLAALKMASILEVEDLIKRYQNATDNAVGSVSFSVSPGGSSRSWSRMAQDHYALRPYHDALPISESVILDGQQRPQGGRSRSVAPASSSRGQTWTSLTYLRGELAVSRDLLWVLSLPPGVLDHASALEGAVSELAAGTEGDIFSPVRTFSGGIKRKLQIVHSLIHPRSSF